MVQVSLAKAKSSFSEYASRAAHMDEHIIKHFQRVPQLTVENWLI